MTYQEALKYINSLPRSQASVFTGQKGLARAKKFFVLLANPQDKLKVVHIAGTSGKGTTAMMTSALLVGAGYKVGMALSPHVYDIRERCQINNNLITKKDFTDSLVKVIPAVEELKSEGYEISYFELLLGLAFCYFIDQKVDYAVIETGLGGLLDATNTITNSQKVSVITRIGKDHTNVLGNDIEDITAQKAGIIQPNNYVIALSQGEKIKKVITKRVKEQHADILWVKPNNTNNLSKINKQFVGDFQHENFALALSVINYLSRRDGWSFDKDSMLKSMEELRIPGRFEIFSRNKKEFILDGAHNPQKLLAVMNATKLAYPNSMLGTILAMRSSKEIPMIPADYMVLTTQYRTESNQDMAILPYNSTNLASQIISKNKNIHARATDNLSEAIQIALSSDVDTWLISGSFFLLSDAKKLLA